ncbi:serine hydrolase domain-containing protein [Paenibacillus chartarius]|uniref:Serine hydrolase domain-containing protein n=1 Tax=Paenibacillus chartarius TaxID=747481 RepID=A0ABV6DLR9_9BACL
MMDEILQEVMALPKVRRWAEAPGHRLSVGIAGASGTAVWPKAALGEEDGMAPLYEIGSITKTMTGLLLAIGEERGMWRRTDRLSELIPEWAASPFAARTNLLQLVTHTAGLDRMPANFSKTIQDRMNPYASYSEDKLEEAVRSETLRKQGRHQYSNYGFGLLGWILSKRTGLNYPELLHEWVFAPLGMAHTSAKLQTQQTGRLLPVFSGKGRPVPHWEFQDTMAGAGAVRSTLPDMLGYIQAHLHAEGEGHPMEEPLKECRKEHHLLFAGKGIGVGYAWMFYKEKDGSTTYWHNGGTYGSSSFAAFNPAKRIGFVILSNYGATLWSQLPLLGSRSMNADKLATIVSDKILR